jgi:ferrochelatase
VTVGVVLMSYGTPATPEDVAAYYTHIRGSRPPTAEQLADLRRRYDAIGGLSPLAERTRAQAAGLQDALGSGFLVAAGAKHAPPFIEDAVAGAVAAGAESLVGLVLAPHYSALSVGEYLERAGAAADTAGIPFHGVRSWHTEPALLDLLAARLSAALSGSPEPVTVLFTAHSLPERVRAMGDPYPDQVEETAAAVAARAGVERWAVAWQSAGAGRGPDPWLGPDLGSALAAVASEGGAAVVACPIGFTSDHLEILYDLDVEAAARARELGLGFSRTQSLNDDPAFCSALAAVVRAALPLRGAPPS